MTQPDPDRADWPDLGVDTGAMPTYPRRRSGRHARHAVDAPDSEEAPADTWRAPTGTPDITASLSIGPAEDGGTDTPRASRAGRDLPAAIGVGLGLAAVVLVSLFAWPPAFLAVVSLAAMVGTWELVRAARVGGVNAPLPPLLVGGPAMACLAWFGGPGALPLGLVATALAIIVWRLGDGVPGYQRDVSVAVMIATYVPFLASFAVLLLRSEPHGQLWVLVTLVGVVLSDTGGYVTGVLFGRHPMAPSVSPKKSWEGFAGSVVCTAVGSALLLRFTLDTQWWQGAVFGAVVSAASVLGDLAESLIKRDLGVKDMSSLLPGHGGLMDRLDSILLAAPTAFALLVLFTHGSS
jgi:phosphatidate cytidylyltransferase